MNIHDLTRLLVVCLAASLVSACSGLLDSKQIPERTFLLKPFHAESVSAPAGRGLSFELDVVPGLDTDRFLTLAFDAELSYLSGVRWPDNLPEFAGALIRRSLQQSGRYTRVSDARNSSPADCVLELEVQQFYTLLDPNGNPTKVNISIAGRHECDGSRTPVSLNASVAVTSRQAAAIVAAHQSAMDEVTRSLHQQLLAAESQLE